MEDEIDEARSTHCTWEMHTKFWSENLKGRYHLEDLGEAGV
jgi:hypothetical protein